MTPIEPMKSSTLKAPSEAVVTLLKYSAAVTPLVVAALPALDAAGVFVAAFGAAWPCAAARLANANPISPASATAEMASAAFLDQSLINESLPQRMSV